MKKLKKLRWTHIYIAVLFLFTVFIALDTFVISYSEKDGSQVDESMFEDRKDSEEPKNPWLTPRSEDEDSDGIYYPIVTENSYQTENFSVIISELRKYDTSIYVAEVKVSSARYLKTAFANDTFGRNVTALTSEIAEDHGAIFAVNGDYYGAREKGIVIRNGILYRTQADSFDLLCIYADGSFKIYQEGERDAEALVKEGVWQCMTFGPGLIEDGEITVSDGQEVKFSMQSNPRTAIGIVDELSYIFVVSDGRTDESRGLSLLELAEVMQELGAVTAYNLDGGGSSSMYFNGRVVNNPTSSGASIQERGVSDIVYIG